METPPEILDLSDLEYKSTKALRPYVKYEEGYSHDRLPPLVRFKDRRIQRFTSVRSCSKESKADRNARRALKSFREDTMRYNPELELVRSGWEEGVHYWNNKGGGFGTSGRSCNGYALATFYLDFRRPTKEDLAAMEAREEAEEGPEQQG